MSALTVHLQQMWRVITEQKDLDLPAHKVMVAHIRCKDIAREQLTAITNDGAWQNLLDRCAADSNLVEDFAESAASLIQSCLYGYDTEAVYFVDSVRNEQKGELEQALFAGLRPAFEAQQAVLQQQMVAQFEARLEAAANAAGESVADAATASTDELVSQYQGVTRLGAAVVAESVASSGQHLVRSSLCRTNYLRPHECRNMVRLVILVSSPAHSADEHALRACTVSLAHQATRLRHTSTCQQHSCAACRQGGTLLACHRLWLDRWQQ